MANQLSRLSMSRNKWIELRQVLLGSLVTGMHSSCHWFAWPKCFIVRFEISLSRIERKNFIIDRAIDFGRLMCACRYNFDCRSRSRCRCRRLLWGGRGVVDEGCLVVLLVLKDLPRTRKRKSQNRPQEPLPKQRNKEQQL